MSQYRCCRNTSINLLTKQAADISFEVLSSIHTIIYNRTATPGSGVEAAYKISSLQLSPGKYVVFTTASGVEFRFTPSKGYINNMDFEIDGVSPPPVDGIFRVKTFAANSPDSSANCVGICIRPACLFNC